MIPPTPLRRAGNAALYRQAAERLREQIACGELQVGESLPSEAVLASRFGVSLITVRHALRELQDEGLIRKRSAKRAVVAAAAPVARTLNNLADVIAATHGGKLEILAYEPRRAPVAEHAFALPAGTRCPCLHGRMLRGGQPISEITIYFPPAIGACLSRADFDDVVVFRSVERRLGLKLAGAQITVAAELAEPALAQLLDVTAGSAILTSTMLYHTEDGSPVELTIARHRADLYSLSYELRAG
ncbi:MAG: GntR family transcriptional regulator [Acetobacteraceae bacterium]|nr:GntR family transcriptional regulator [Acetobacteraceae bacterium]